MRATSLTVAVVLITLAVPVNSDAALLYDQTDAEGANWSPSDQFQSGQEQFNTETADDFSVPAGARWTISTVDVIGRFSTVSLPPQVNVSIYANVGNLPGTTLFSGQAVTAPNGPNYSVPLTGAPPLTRGKYWISVQQTGAVDQMGGFDDIWLWQARNFQSGQPAALRGFNCYYPAWGVRRECMLGIQAPDQLFALEGDLISNRFKFRKPRRKLNGSLVVPVEFANPGKIVASDARASFPRIRTVRTAVDEGTERLVLKPTRQSKKRLDRGRRVKVNLKVTFKPDEYRTHSQRKRITLVKPPAG